MEYGAGLHSQMPFTIREALYGNAGLEPCVRHVLHEWEPTVLRRLRLFEPIIDRPKQAIHHLFELFILHVCQLSSAYNLRWVEDLVQYLSAISQHLIRPVQPEKSIQWAAAIYDGRGRIRRYVPQKEECYPRSEFVEAAQIVGIISRYTRAFMESDITRKELSCMSGLMDEPAKTAVMVYAWYLNTYGIKNGWLRPFLNSPLGRRERDRRVPEASRRNVLIAGGRLGRAGETLHTLYALAFIDTRGHLMWYTIRKATRGEIIGGLACSYARGNNCRINSSKDMRRSIQIRYDHVCNFELLDFRLWDSWTHNLRSTGPCKSMGSRKLSLRAVRFDEPVILENALAVGYRIVEGMLINPRGKSVQVLRRGDGLFRVRGGFLRSADKGPIHWDPRMRLV